MKKVTISIKGSQMGANDADESFELVTDGELESEDGVLSLSYVESELTGFDGMLTTFKVGQDSVVLSRGGGLIADMIFSEKQKHHFLYETPFGAITMGIDTRSIKKNLSGDGGSLEIRYVIDVDNMVVSRNSFMIEITPGGGQRSDTCYGSVN